MNTLGAVRRILIKFSETIVVTMFLLMITVSFIQVVSRYIFNYSLSWSEEMARYLFVWIVFLGAPIVQDRNAHLGVDLLLSKFQGRAKVILQMLINIAIGIFTLVLIRTGAGLVLMTMDQPSAALKIPMAYIYFSIPLGAGIMLLVCFHDVLKSITNLSLRGDTAK
ncbi:TRAP transporter small permease [Biomaibacter acetigenes]|jgi:TRAP-type C4-dicarboxylate transport system permease small subunit|uniref:TRAP transporter small permease n=1 Tax=Biomaibacter acetigenes TaxID=2316383 RepID=A0A3G2R2S2_9FIRM|nr:TRAP transporter small permease [Biomaibacter acetigenes]AYO29784.1 TRAP transporter small permease [Biomaibacter acetigenes]